MNWLCKIFGHKWFLYAVYSGDRHYRCERCGNLVVTDDGPIDA